MRIRQTFVGRGRGVVTALTESDDSLQLFNILTALHLSDDSTALDSLGRGGVSGQRVAYPFPGTPGAR